MLLLAAGVIVALVCVAAGARRLWFVACPTALHPDDVVAALGPSPSSEDFDRVRAIVARTPGAEWERDLFAALSAPTAADRAALVNEQLSELDYRLQRWARVPASCVRIGTTLGFLLALAVMWLGLDQGELDGDVGSLVLRGFVGDAVTVIAICLAGVAFCFGAHGQARRMARERSQATDRMVEKLEALRAAEDAYRGN